MMNKSNGEKRQKPSVLMELPRIQTNATEPILTSQHVDSPSSTSFTLQNNSSEPQSPELVISESHSSLYVSKAYREQFYDHYHTNCYGEFDGEGPFIVSLRCSPCKILASDTYEAHAIIRTQSRNYNIVELMNKNNEGNILQILFNKAQLPAVQSYGTIGDPKANEKIFMFDKTNDERYNCKIGVIYQRSNQSNEQDIFNNDTNLNDMFGFLDLISERVRLKGFQKYRGDLDINEDLHGEHSYYAEHENHEIMFNIAPIIPGTNSDEKYTIRKGLVGNAFVCIVFQEPGAIFSPDYISGKVTQIYIIVQPVKKYEKLHYKIGIWRRQEISDMIEPTGGVLTVDSRFPSYFRTLLLNSIDVAIKSPRLRNHIYEQRQRLKFEEIKKLCQSFSVGLLPDLPNEIDSSHNHPDCGINVRADSFHSTVTNATSDTSSTTNATRTPPPVQKKKGLQKFLGVFSARSASMSSTTAPVNHQSQDTTPTSPPSLLTPESYLTFGRTATNQESAGKQRSSKGNHAVSSAIRSIHPLNLTNHNSPNTAPAQSNRFNPLNMTDTNEIDPVVFSEPLRGRSNSSPQGVCSTNKSQSFSVSKPCQELSSDSETEGSEGAESDDEL